ncbi:uridine kinase family protein [Haloferula sargassicola]|uniref:uridine/cytidine kinase n=1 Tax=Haloferula sargassicola TaxID=490096 RepID=A0ABP9UKX1_9BACT
MNADQNSSICVHPRSSTVSLIVIAGGSGSGKSRLARLLHEALPASAVLTLDHFYRDLSHLTPGQRERVNFDDPATIDWASVETALFKLSSGHPAEIPRYDFHTHTRAAATETLQPTDFLILEGLWPLTRPAIRDMAALTIFVDCPAGLRLSRRIARDTTERGRTEASVRRQCAEHVEPMHARHVQPQIDLAGRVLTSPISDADVQQLLQAATA